MIFRPRTGGKSSWLYIWAAYIFSLCFSLLPSMWEHARPSFLYSPFYTVPLDQKYSFLTNLDLGHIWVSTFPGIISNVDPSLLCPSLTRINGQHHQNSSLKCGCRYKNYSINTTQLYVSAYVGVQNMSDNVSSSSGISTNTLVFFVWLWGWSEWEGFCFFFSSHLTNLTIRCHHVLHPDCCRNPSFTACLIAWLFFLFFSFNKLFFAEQDWEVMSFIRAVLAHMILDSLTETMGQPIISMRDCK